MVRFCDQLKLKAKEGKYYKTDVVDIKEMLRIIESILSKNAEPVKQWLAKLGSKRINNTFNHSIAFQRALNLYRVKGYYEEVTINKLKELIEKNK